MFDLEEEGRIARYSALMYCECGCSAGEVINVRDLRCE